MRERERERERKREGVQESRLSLIKAIITRDTRNLSEIKSPTFRKALRAIYFLINFFRYARYFKPSFICLTHINIQITTRCTLNCKDCNSLMPYYSKFSRHWDVNVDELLKNINNLLNGLDAIMAVSVLGGEVFLFSEPELCRLLEGLKSYGKIVKIHLLTNGTLIPSKSIVSHLRDPKIEVRISDYGKLSSKKDELVSFLSENKISHFVVPYCTDGWIEFGNLTKRGRSRDELQRLSSKCISFMRCNPIVGNRFYSCSLASNMTDLGLKPDERDDFIELVDKPKIMRANIKKFLSMDCIPSCDFCDFALGKKTKAAVQREPY